MTEVGDLIGARYRLVKLVGSGSMGVVWQAKDEILRRDVAVKELRLLPGMSPEQTDEARRRTMREGRITARLQNPNAITVYDVAEHYGRPCLIMEFLPSSSLDDLLTQRGVLPVAEVAMLGRQIAAALAAAHDAGIVHRDVKPGNVLLTVDGTAKLTDFGISHAVGDGTITASGVLAGTPAFLAPEVAKGSDPDFRSDVFSFGATLYTALEGQPPYGLNENPIGMLHQIATRDVIPPKNAGALASALTWMLQPDPADRPTMKQAQEALIAVDEGTAEEPILMPVPAPTAVATAVEEPVVPAAEPATAPSPTLAAPAAAAEPKQRDRRRALVAVGVVAVLAVAGIVITLLTRGNTAHPTAAADTGRPTTTQQAAPPATTTKPVTTTQPTTTHAVTTTTTVSPPGGSSAVTVSTPSDPAAFIESYYQLVPNNLPAAWPEMTQDYQTNHAGGWAHYQSFWGQYSSVSLSGVAKTGADSVVATIHYVKKTGGTVTETTNFTLVQQGGQWKIAASSLG